MCILNEKWVEDNSVSLKIADIYLLLFYDIFFKFSENSFVK